MEEETQNPPILLSQSNSVRRRNNDPNSPEFEFWMVRNPSFPQPVLVSADELIVNGVLLPLDLVSLQPETSESLDTNPKADIVEKETELELSQPGPAPDSSTVSSASKRWKDIFKMGDKKTPVAEGKERNNEKKKERKSVSVSGGTSGVSSGAELNINIWPFSRSWSAGTGGTRSKIRSGSVSRKVSSAPCSRSNSAGESKSRKWPNSPSRGGGIHLGRNSPVWQVRRGGSGLKDTEPVVRNVEKRVRKQGGESRTLSNGGEVGPSKSSRGLNLNVPMCIGYRQQLSCRRDESLLVGGGGGESSGGGGGGEAGGALGGNKLFYLRALFTKKVY